MKQVPRQTHARVNSMELYYMIIGGVVVAFCAVTSLLAWIGVLK